MDQRAVILLVALLGGYYLYTTQDKPPSKEPDCPDGKCPVKPAPAPVKPKPAPEPDEPIPEPLAPRRPRKPWGKESDAPVGAKVLGRVHDDGTEIRCDLDPAAHQKNTGGSDGAGLCVFASMRHSGLWQGNEVFADLFNFMKKHPGGSYPQKTDQMIAKYCQETGKPKPRYLQVEGGDLEVLKRACASGRMPGVTYSVSPTGRYGGSRISHMVSLVHADDRHFVVLDNNYPGREGKEDIYEWLTPQEFARSYAPGWAVILLDPPGPPPRPWNEGGKQ